MHHYAHVVASSRTSWGTPGGTHGEKRNRNSNSRGCTGNVFLVFSFSAPHPLSRSGFCALHDRTQLDQKIEDCDYDCTTWGTHPGMQKETKKEVDTYKGIHGATKEQTLSIAKKTRGRGCCAREARGMPRRNGVGSGRKLKVFGRDN